MNEKLKIGFVAEPYEVKEASGMGYSVRETMRQLAKHAHSYELTIYSSKPIDYALVPGEYRNIIIPHGFAGQFVRFWRMQKEVDVLFFVVALLPFWIPQHTKTVVICKELTNQNMRPGSIREMIKVFIRDKLLMPHCIRKASLVLASTLGTKKDVMKYYHIPEEKIELVYEGFQDWNRFKESAPPIDKKLLPYFVFAGKVKTRKNVHGIVDAFIALKESTKSNAKLVIIGSYGGTYYEGMHKKLSAHHLRDEVFFLGYRSASEMYTLFTNAIAMVFPSLSEGFGMPLVEAMSLGLPVIASNIPALAEVVADAGVLVEPVDINGIARAMEEVMSIQTLRESLIQKGYARSKDFSWDKVGEKYAEVIHRLEAHEL